MIDTEALERLSEQYSANEKVLGVLYARNDAFPVSYANEVSATARHAFVREIDMMYKQDLSVSRQLREAYEVVSEINEQKSRNAQVLGKMLTDIIKEQDTSSGPHLRLIKHE